MFITSFGEQNITYKCCSNFLIHLSTTGCYQFRVTRNADLTIHEDGAEDLLIEIERFLKERKSGSAVRLELDCRTSEKENVEWLIDQLEIEENDIYYLDGPLDLTFLFGLVEHLAQKLKYLT